MSKKYMKAIASVLLVVAMVLQMIPSSVFVIKAEDISPATATSTIGKIEKGANDIFYKCLDISEYRAAIDNAGNYESYPKEDGFVFAGWYQEANETTEVAKETKTGTAWAKFVPEDTLFVKAQTTQKMKADPNEVKFRLNVIYLRKFLTK